MLHLYSAPENYLGIIYRRDLLTRQERFSRFITQQQVTLLGMNTFVEKEIKLTPRTAFIRIEDIFTEDQVPLNVEMKIFYKVDPREAAPESLLQVLHFPEEAFETIVKTNIEEKARNDIFIRRTSSALFTSGGRNELRYSLSAAIAERVSGFGILINPQYGVAIINLQPNKVYHQALQDQSAAQALSEASIRRINPMLETLSQADLQKALQIAFMQIASAISKTGDIPEYFYPEGQGNMNNNPERGNGSGQAHQPGGPFNPPPQQPQRMDRNYPTAAD